MQELAERSGLGWAEFHTLTGIERADLHAPHGVVDADKFLRVLAFLDHHQLIPILPLEGFDDVGRAFPDLLALYVNSPTLRQALHDLLRYRPVLGNTDEVELRESDDRLELVYRHSDTAGHHSSSALCTFALVAKIVRLYTRACRYELRIDLIGCLPVPHPQLEASVACRIRQHQNDNRLVCISADLDEPWGMFNPLVDQLTRQRLDNQLQGLRKNLGGLAAQLQREVRDLLRESYVAESEDGLLEHLCQHHGVSRWTLQRRLQREGRTLAEVFAEARVAELDALLTQGKLSLADIGERLGFAQPSSLTRFCRQHLGMTPSQYRDRLN